MEIKLKSNVKNRKRVGRGISAGGGKTAGRGTKGQKSRSGYNIPNRFEGGQTPLTMRLPKIKGFKRAKKEIRIIDFDTINEAYKDGEVISHDTLVKKGLIKESESAKVLNNGKLKVKVSVADDLAISNSAKLQIETMAKKK